jgi:hypothetical protein
MFTTTTQAQKRQMILSERETRIVEARKAAAAAGRRLAAAYRSGSVARPHAPVSATRATTSPVARRRQAHSSPRRGGGGGSPDRSKRMASPVRSPRLRTRSPSPIRAPSVRRSPRRSPRAASPIRRAPSSPVMLDALMAPQIEVAEMRMQSAEMKIASVLTAGMLGTVEQINRHFSAFPLSGNKEQKTQQIISMLRDGRIQCANLQKQTLVAAGNKIVGRGTFSESNTLDEICSRITETA